MGVNRDKVDFWKIDIEKSVDFYNKWFLTFAPKTYRETREKTTIQVKKALDQTDNLNDVNPDVLFDYPAILPMLRMSTCPPIARDRLIGLAGISMNLVRNMEIEKRLPPKMNKKALNEQLDKICSIITSLIDPDIFVWMGRKNRMGSEEEIHRASTIVADRLCGALADPIIRNAQEKRQLSAIKKWLLEKGYNELDRDETKDFRMMPPGSFTFHLNVPVNLEGGKKVNIPIDAVIMKKESKSGDFPVLFEAKSAGDFTNTNKRRKEELVKIIQLHKTYGQKISFNLFLCGYFDSGYLGYEAAEGIDWVWEHRIEDLEKFGF